MTKSTITRTWVGGLTIFAAGIVASMIGVFLMLANGGTFTQVAGSSKYDFTPSLNGFFWTAVGIIVVGGMVALIGGIVQLVAWAGAFSNSHSLPTKTWFLVLLFGALVGLAFAPIGFAVMVAYVVAAPDGTPYRQSRATTTAQQPRPLAPTT